MIILQYEEKIVTAKDVSGPIWIYFLYDNYMNVRYVGKTKSIKTRISCHRHPKTNVHRDNWLRKMYRDNRLVTMSLIEKCSEKIWQEREQHWIKFGRSKNWDLTNQTDGGEGMHGRTYVMSEERKLAISKAKKGVPCPEWQKEHLRRVNTGKKHSKETREKISKLSKGFTKEIRCDWTGRKHSKETREKMRVSAIKRKRLPWSDEAKENMRQAAIRREKRKRED